MDVYASLLADERDQLLARLDAHRHGLRSSLDGLTQDEARRRLVPSATTLVGLIAHVTYAETVWAQEAVGGVPRAHLGLTGSAAEAFALDSTQSIDTVLAAHQRAVTASHEVLDSRDLDEVVTGHALGPMTVRWVFLHLISEMAQHHAHADILREQILAGRSHPQA